LNLVDKTHLNHIDEIWVTAAHLLRFHHLETDETDYDQFYNLETYLTDVVRPRFVAQGFLSALDLFCIIIWKANRAKSKVATNLLGTARSVLGKSNPTLDEATEALTRGLTTLGSPKARMRYLWETWRLRLPMASAILTVLYPTDFTVYDTRVSSVLGKFKHLGAKQSFDALWQEYLAYKASVEAAAPSGLTLREKDRYLWGRSFYEDLQRDLASGFGATQP
jgi:hypothetical protein